MNENNYYFFKALSKSFNTNDSITLPIPLSAAYTVPPELEYSFVIVL
jgi:hypothetical protein